MLSNQTLHWTKLNRQGRQYFKLSQRDQNWIQLLRNEEQEDFEMLGLEGDQCLCLLIANGFTLSKSNFSLTFVTGSNFINWSKAQAEVRFLPSHRPWERGLQSLLMRLKGWLLGPWKRSSWVIKLARGF